MAKPLGVINMKNLNIYLLWMAIITMQSSCRDSIWTKEEKESFAKECDGSKEVEPGPIGFKGFDYNEIETIRIVEWFADQPIDTTFVYAPEFYPNYSNYWINLSVKINIDHIYEVQVGSSKSYILDNMQTVARPQYTMFSQNYGCTIGAYHVNGKRHEDGNIIFTKK